MAAMMKLPSLRRFLLHLDGAGQRRLPQLMSHACSAANLTTMRRGMLIAASDGHSRRRCKRRAVHHVHLVIARSKRGLRASGGKKSGGSSESDRWSWSDESFTAKLLMHSLRNTLLLLQVATCRLRYRHSLASASRSLWYARASSFVMSCGSVIVMPRRKSWLRCVSPRSWQQSIAESIHSRQRPSCFSVRRRGSCGVK